MNYPVHVFFFHRMAKVLLAAPQLRSKKALEKVAEDLGRGWYVDSTVFLKLKSLQEQFLSFQQSAASTHRLNFRRLTDPSQDT